MKRIRNFIVLLRFWKVLKKSSRVINDPDSVWSSAVSQGLSVEEAEGVVALEHIYSYLMHDPKLNKQELKELGKSLNS